MRCIEVRSVVVTVGSIPTSCKTDSAGLFYAGFNAAVFSRLSQLPTLPGSRHPPLRTGCSVCVRTKQTQRFSNIWRHAQVQNRLKVSAYKNVGTSNCDGLSKEQERTLRLSLTRPLESRLRNPWLICGVCECDVTLPAAFRKTVRRAPLGRCIAGFGVKPLALAITL